MPKRLFRLPGLSCLLKWLRPQPIAGAPLQPYPKNTTGMTRQGRDTDLTALQPSPGIFSSGFPTDSKDPGHPPTFLSEIVLPDALDAYLAHQGNSQKDIALARRILMMDQVILETGCGGGEVALAIANTNPQIGVIATDKYELAETAGEGSHYRETALAWEKGCLQVQQAALPNLVILKAEAEILHYLPDKSVDSILVVNPEPLVGMAFVESLKTSSLLRKVKAGKNKIVIKPYSREMNVMSCGGLEFDHSEDWSCGLGFILGSDLPFKKANPVQWSVDLSKASPYCKNSTQNCVYVLADEH